MRLIVTGGAGFIGSAVVRRAVAQGHEVMNLDALTYAACLDNVASVADAPNYHFVQADIRDRAAMDAALSDFKPDAVMHLAAAADIPTVGLFGPSDYRHYAPWGFNSRVVRTPQGFDEIFPPNFDHRNSGSLMDGLTVDRVEEAVRDLWASLAREAA